MKGITLRDYIDTYRHFCWEMSIAANALVNLFLNNMKFEGGKTKKGGGAGKGLLPAYIY